MSFAQSSNIFYPAINESDLQWGLAATTVGFQSTQPFSRYPTSNHPESYLFATTQGRVLDEYQLVYITKGNGVFESASVTKTEITEGMLFMLFPKEWHTYWPKTETGWNTYWVGFKGSYADNLATNQLFSKSKSIFNIGYKEEIVMLFKNLMLHAEKEESGFQALLGGIILHLLGYVHHYRQQESFADKEIVSKINQAKLLMRENVTTIITPEEIASELAISYSWFRRMFQKYTGFSPGQYIKQLKLQKAKQLLENSDKRIKQIASLLSFTSPYYFSVFFKHQTGITPIEFRIKSRGKVPRVYAKTQ